MSLPVEPGPGGTRSVLGGRYTIERELGAGGMATVWLARDLRHDRDVAVKVLRPELAATLGAERFLREVRLTARLQHPHILTLIDSDCSDGQLWYVVPWVRGESLRDRLQRERQLGIEDAVAIVRQVAAALDYAHQQGVVHRDVKPENILLHEGEAVLADFGIALALREAGGQRLTETGISLGTPEYMSPEQATGNQAVDGRSDVYSLAAVLYEMLAGEPPVTGKTLQTLMAKLLTERPVRLRTLRDTVPEVIDEAVARALAKVPADRFGSAGDFVAALGGGGTTSVPAVSRWRRRGWLLPAAAVVVLVGAGLFAAARALSDRAAGPTAARRADAFDGLRTDEEWERSVPIAVLPFRNLTGDSSRAYLVEGLNEQVTDALSSLGAFRVVSARGAGQEAALSPVELARRLSADVVLDGSYRQFGNRIRINAELINGRTGDHVWTQQFEREAGDVFALYDDIARSIAVALEAKVAPGSLVIPSTDDLQAYHYFLRGRHAWNRLTPASLQESLSFYDSAIASDPGYALAYVARAEALGARAQMERWAPVRQWELMRRELMTALELDPLLAEAHMQMGQVIANYTFDWAFAEREIRQALQLKPSSAIAYTWYAQYLGVMGHHRDAVRAMKRAQELDPLSPFVRVNLAARYLFARQYDSALAANRYALELDSTFWVAHWLQGDVLLSMRRYAESIQALHKALDLSGGSLEPMPHLALAYLGAGRRAEASSVLRQLETRARTEYVPATFFALIYCGLGPPERAIEWSWRAFEDRDWRLTHGLLPSSHCDHLEQHPRFVKLVNTLGLQHTLRQPGSRGAAE